MSLERLSRLRCIYRDGLLNDVVPFWTKNAIDSEFGGFLTCLDRQGRVIDTDKGIWLQGRMSWLYATLYSEVEPRQEWLLHAQSGANFLREHGFDQDGRMFFHVTREGRPIRKRRYFFSECFTVMAYAALARAENDSAWAARAREVFSRVVAYIEQPDLLPSKFTPVRPTRGLAVPMIMLITAQVLRKTIDDQVAAEWINRSIAEIEEFFVKDEHSAVLETVGRNGEILDHFEGRLLNPGHAIEAAWFILSEAKHRGGDVRLITLGTKMLDWMWERGWDTQYGGILYFRDLRDLPIQEYWHDMKFWWPHNEAIIATLLAWQLTRDDKYLRWHEQVHDWSHVHFPDPEFGEWYGYLHRDGRVSTTLKGNMWKSAFHLPRMQLLCWQILEEELSAHNPPDNL
jgi:N-acylglucosamine 2-epimerase